jgi:RimJ/RimL family protein N-acetyltransferase
VNPMIYKLQKEQYKRVGPLFQTLDYNLTVNAVLAGTTPGEIYVDDPVQPKAAITWVKHRIYLAGSARNEGFNRAVNQLFSGKIVPGAVAAGKAEFVLYYAPEDWDDQVDILFEGKFPIKDRRLYFIFKEPRNDWRALIPPGCTMRRVDRELLRQTYLKNLDTLIEEIHSERESIDRFFGNGFGFCLTQGDEIAGWCFSEFNTRDRCEVGIETAEAHRRRGFATLTASALVEHALANGVTRIGWHCWASNTASITLAEKVGFEKSLEYPVYFGRFDERDNRLVHGWFYLYRLHRYREAAEWYEKAFELGEAWAGAYYDTARAWALAGEGGPSFRNLYQAIAHGWTDVARLKEDEDFKVLHGTEDWEELLEKLEAA